MLDSLEVDVVRRFVNKCQIAIGQYALAQIDAAELLSTIEHDKPRTTAPCATLVNEGLLAQIYRRLNRVTRLDRSTLGCEAVYCADPRIAGALRYIREHIDRGHVRIADASSAVGLSTSHLTHMFKKATGASFSEHVRRARITAVAQLLTDTFRSVKEIAAQVGYAHVSNLDRDFRRAMGCRPTDFRNAQRAKQVSAESANS